MLADRSALLLPGRSPSPGRPDRPRPDRPDAAAADDFTPRPRLEGPGPQPLVRRRGPPPGPPRPGRAPRGAARTPALPQGDQGARGRSSPPPPPRQIHAGLLLTGAEPGHPVRFLPKFEPPAGTADRHRAGVGRGRQDPPRRRPRVGPRRAQEGPARHRLGLRRQRARRRPGDQAAVSTPADDGDLITVANFASAILDLPFASTANDADRSFVANTDQIPPGGPASPSSSRLDAQPPSPRP